MFWERARALGPAVLALVGFYGAVAALTLPVFLVLPDSWGEGQLGFVVRSLPAIGAALLVNALLVRQGWSSWRALGWPGAGVGAGGWVHGTVVGVTLAAGAVGLAVAAGGAAVTITGEPVTAYLAAAVRLGLVLLIAALSEELLFRGYPLARLSRTLGKPGAAVLLSVGFALVHLGNPEVTAFGLVNIGLASLALSAAFFTRGGLPAAWGLHFGWNGGLAIGADAPVSGVPFDVPLLEFVPGSREWVTGGTFGPEGGMVASLAMAAGLAWFVRMARRGGGNGS